MLWLVTKRSTHYSNREALNMFNHYLKLMHVITSDTNFIDYIKLIDDNGEIIKEYYRDEE